MRSWLLGPWDLSHSLVLRIGRRLAATGPSAVSSIQFSVNTLLEPSKKNIATVSSLPNCSTTTDPTFTESSTYPKPQWFVISPRLQNLLVRSPANFLGLLTFNHSRHHHPPRLLPPLQALGALLHGLPLLQAA